MSDYEVNLVNDSMQEFYVRFYGPAESACFLLTLTGTRTLTGGSLYASAARVPRWPRDIVDVA